MYLNWELDNKGRTPENRSSTVENCNQDIVGIQRAVLQLPANIAINDAQACFRRFFQRNRPPIHLRLNTLHRMRYICQQVPGQQTFQGPFYYATMYDEGAGIPVYSAYFLYSGNNQFRAQGARGWSQTPGNLLTCTLKR